jgi:hypothetical protein
MIYATFTVAFRRIFGMLGYDVMVCFPFLLFGLPEVLAWL